MPKTGNTFTDTKKSGTVFAILRKYGAIVPPPRVSGLLEVFMDPGEMQLYSLRYHHHDEGSREFQVDELFFDLSTGVILEDGRLSPDDGYASTVTRYNAAGNVEQSFNDNGHNSTTIYDTAGRVWKMIDAGLNTVEKEYDDVGNQKKETFTDYYSDTSLTPVTYSSTSQHDSMGRRSTGTNPSGEVTTHDYNAQGRRTGSTDNLDHDINHTYDGMGRVIVDQYLVAKPPTVTDTHSLRVVYDYDGDGRLVSMTDGLTQSTRYLYDNLGRKVRETAPDTTYMELRYDEEDRVTGLRDANGNEVNTSYDPLGRVVLVELTDAAPDTVGSTHQVFVLDAVGNRVKQYDLGNDPSDTILVSRTYTSRGDVLSEAQNWQTSTSSYDGVGNRMEYVYPDGRRLEYEYDSLERLSRILDLGYQPKAREHVEDVLVTASILTKSVLAEYSYVGSSRLHERVLAGHVTQTNTYDAGMRLSSLKYTDSGGSTSVGFEYTYDAVSRLKEKEKLHGGGTEEYTMDGLGRLTKFEDPSGLSDVTSREWTLDDANNWASTKTTAGSTVTETRTHSVNNELMERGAIDYVYDANGNLVSDGAREYKWDFKNRLREVWTTSSVQLAEYWYDAENRRVRKDVGLESTLYFLDGMNEVQESNCLGIVSRQFVYGGGVDELILMDAPLVQVGSLMESCNLFTGGGDPDLLKCSLDTVSTLMAATCGPLDVETDGSEVHGQWAVCVSGAWILLDTSEPSPASGCVVCDGVHAPGSGVLELEIGSRQVAFGDCNPCTLPSGNLVTGSGTATVFQLQYETSCTPCPTPHVEAGFTFASDTPPFLTPSDPVLEERPCIMIDPENRKLFLQDEQRSVYGLTNATGHLLEGYEYDPYGRVLVIQPGSDDVVGFDANDDHTTAVDALSPYLYTGRRYDAETGFLYFRTRYYDEEMGRFISRDTIGVWGDPNSLGNGYAYVGNLVQSFVDPCGTRGWQDLKYFWRAVEWWTSHDDPCVPAKQDIGSWSVEGRHRINEIGNTIEKGGKKQLKRLDDHADKLDTLMYEFLENARKWWHEFGCRGTLHDDLEYTLTYGPAASQLAREMSGAASSFSWWVPVVVVVALVLAAICAFASGGACLAALLGTAAGGGASA